MRTHCQSLPRISEKERHRFCAAGSDRKEHRDEKKEIDETFGGDGRIQTVPFTERVNLYMNASDVMISKPGGLTSTEAAVANIPLVHLLAYTGCETKTSSSFPKGDLARAGNVKDAVHCAWNLIDDKKSLADSMREMQRKYIAPDAADRIVSKVISYV